MLLDLLKPLTAKLALGLGLALMAALACLHLEHKGRRNAEQALATTKVAYETAQAAATAYAVANKTNIETANARRKERADDDYQTALGSNRDRADRYAADHRVVRCKTAEGVAGRADLPGAAGPAEVADGPGRDADLVAILRRDFDLCTDNSTRLKNAHDWALPFAAPD